MHLNHLENMVGAEAERTSRVLQEIRDDCVLVPGLNHVVVGTNEAIAAVIQKPAQLRRVFGIPAVVGSSAPEEVEALLQKRYDPLRIDAGRPVPPLVAPESLRELYGIFAATCGAPSRHWRRWPSASRRWRSALPTP